MVEGEYRKGSSRIDIEYGLIPIDSFKGYVDVIARNGGCPVLISPGGEYVPDGIII